PGVHGVPGNGRCNNKSDDHPSYKVFVEQHHDFFYGGAVHFADANLPVSLIEIKQDKAIQPHGGYAYGQKGEPQVKLAKAAFRLVLAVKLVVGKDKIEVVFGVVLVPYSLETIDGFTGVLRIHAQGKITKLPRVLVVPNHRIDGLLQPFIVKVGYHSQHFQPGGVLAFTEHPLANGFLRTAKTQYFHARLIDNDFTGVLVVVVAEIFTCKQL